MTDKTIMICENITKRFPGVIAVKNANLIIKRGQVHAVVGGNGAGKSTLMKIISGVHPHNTYEGTITLSGEQTAFKNILEAQSQGIYMISQELNMPDELSIAENLFLDKYPTKNGIVDHYKIYTEAKEILKEFEIDLNPMTKAKEIGIAQKQLITIARAMHDEVDVLLLDEPTATLSQKESDILFEKIEKLKKKNIAMIYISHRMEEVRAISDVITVMRDGEVIDTRAVDDITDKEIIELMVGRDIGDLFVKSARVPKEIVLKVNNITIADPKIPEKLIVDNVSFNLRRGEILSMYGLVGAGRSETALAMIGAFDGAVECDMEKDNKKIRNLSPADAVNAKIGFLPEDRNKRGVISILGVDKNISISSLENLSKLFIVDDEKEQNLVDEIVKKLSIKTPSTKTPIRNLSGGNAQKCVLGRWIAAQSDILILDEATQGIDVGAKRQIYEIMDGLAKEGKSILFISSDLSEVIGVSDRIITMRNGKIVNITNSEDADKSTILWEATMGSNEEVANG